MFQKLFDFLNKNNDNNQEDDDDDDDIMNFGSINDNKLAKLKRYIIKKDFESFADFSKYYTNNSTHSQCVTSWNQNTIACRCKQCQMCSNSCVCIKCFLEGPHKHHSCIIHITNSGNCDCGNPTGWKIEGFCKKHRCHHLKSQTNNKNQDKDKIPTDDSLTLDDDNYFVPNGRIRESTDPEEENKYAILSPQLKERLLKAFKSVRDDLNDMITKQNFRYFSECCQFFMDFTSLGDEIRSCVCQSLNDVDFLSKIFLQAQNLTDHKMLEFFHLSGSLCSDPIYSIPFTEAASQTIPKLIEILYQNASLPFVNRSSTPISGIDTVLHFDFQYLAVYPVKFLLSQKKFDWIEYLLKYSDILGDFVLHEKNINALLNFESILTSLYSYQYILRVTLHLESEIPKFKEFMIRFCKSIERFEGFVPAHIGHQSQIYDIFEFILNLTKLPYKLMKSLPYFNPEVNDIFIYHLLNRKPRDEIKMRNYSQSVMLHQVFLSNLITFNRKSDYQFSSFIEDIQKSAFDTEKNDENDIRHISFNDCYSGKDPQDTFEYYCRQNLSKNPDISLNAENTNELISKIYLKSIDIPMTLIAAHYLIRFHQGPIRMPSSCMQCVDRFHTHNGFNAYILPNLMALVQVMFSFTSKDKKDNMIKEFASYFGAIDSQYNELNRKMRDFSFVMFLSSLILDRDGINYNYKNICLKNLMTEMKHRTVGSEEILGIISPCTMSTNNFKEKYENMNIENDWNIVIPYYTKMSELYDRVLPTIIEKTQEMLLPFPEFIDPSIGDKENKINICPNLLIRRLPEIFECRYLFALIYYFIFEYNSDIIFIQYALNLFITIAENTKEIDEEIHPISARNIDDLAENIKTNNFRNFVKTPVMFKGNQNYSLAQLVNDLGVIGLSALRRIGMSITNIKKSKKKVLHLKRTISRSLIQNSKRFESTVDRRSHDCCSICHKILGCSENKGSSIENKGSSIENKFDDEMLYIPVSIFKSVTNEFVDNFIHERITGKTIARYDLKSSIRRNMDYKYVHRKCFARIYNSYEYNLMPKIDHLPFNIIDDDTNADDKDDNDENNNKIMLLAQDKNKKNTLEITTKKNNNDGYNFRINFNLNNFTLNGVPLNLNNNNNHNDININLGAINELNDDNFTGPLNFLHDLISRNNSSNTLINNNNKNTIKQLLLKSIFDFLTMNDYYRIALEVLSQMIMTLDHRSRLTPEVLDDTMVSSLYSNLFRNSIYLFYLKDKDVKLSMQIRDSICAVILECLKMKAPKAQTKAYRSMFEKEKQEYPSFISENKEKLGEISFEQYFYSKIVQNKGSLEIQLSTNDNENSQSSEKIMNERSYEFLRRCYLIEKFYLCDNSDVNDLFIDWDFHLNASNLYEHFYHRKLPDNFVSPVLPVYRGLDLPHHFLELIYPPFNISFDKIDKECSMCLFSGAMSQSNYYDYRRFPRFGMPYTVVLNLSGLAITSITFVTQDGISSRNLKSIYVDKNGCPDPGFRRGESLFLSRVKYNQLIDDFLSGNLLGMRRQ